MSSNSWNAREMIFRSLWFPEEVAHRLELDEELVTHSIGAVLEAGNVPCSIGNNSDSLAVDGATMLLAIGSRQSSSESTVRVARRLATMALQCEIGGQSELAGRADLFPQRDSIGFGSDLYAVFQNLWRAARGTTTNGFKGVSVSMLWNDDGSILFGAIEQNQRRRIYASEALQIPAGGWDYVQLPAVGGTKFSPLAILRFGALLDAVVADTTATLNGPEALRVK